MSESSRSVVEQFWATMNTNDWHAAAELFSDDYVLDWPQTGERIRGRANFAAVNGAYPAAGLWRFTVNRLVADGDVVVSDVTVTDGEIVAAAVTFSTVRDGRIIHQREYWPDPGTAPEWRRQWVELVDAGLDNPMP